MNSEIEIVLSLLEIQKEISKERSKILINYYDLALPYYAMKTSFILKI